MASILLCSHLSLRLAVPNPLTTQFCSHEHRGGFWPLQLLPVSPVCPLALSHNSSENPSGTARGWGWRGPTFTLAKASILPVARLATALPRIVQHGFYMLSLCGR